MPNASTAAPQSMRTPVDRGYSFPADPGARSAALDLHKESSTPETKRCERWPKNMELLSTAGEVIQGRCKSPNLCEHCSKLQALENTELLRLDAVNGTPPTMVAILTTGTIALDLHRFYRSREKVIRALRRRWSMCQYCTMIEYTVGDSPTSGGHRRPHWNIPLKGIPLGDLAEAADVIKRVWCAREFADPKAQYVEPIKNAIALSNYFAKHFLKASQRPPEGFRGNRFMPSRGFLWLPTKDARAAAKDSLTQSRLLYRAGLLGLDAYDAELFVHESMQTAEAISWQPIWADEHGWGFIEKSKRSRNDELREARQAVVHTSDTAVELNA
jgi:hypothetical protein